MRTRIISMLVLASTALFAAEQMSKIAPSPAFDKMKTLVGMWDGTVNEGGAQKAHARVKLVSDGSALAHWLDEGTPHEMITMFHMDGNDLMATHYCAAHNQPRMVLVSGGDPNRLVFKFKDGTNIGPEEGHMHELTFTIDAPDHHTEDWTYLEKGKQTTAHFDFHRK